jgi:hypothetical protein
MTAATRMQVDNQAQRNYKWIIAVLMTADMLASPALGSANYCFPPSHAITCCTDDVRGACVIISSHRKMTEQ